MPATSTLGAAFDGVLGAAREGSEWAWTELYRNLSPVMLGYLRAQGAREPEDLTAEVFLQVVRSLGQFQGGESEFRSWVFVIAHHKLIDERRYHGRRPADPTDTEALGTHSGSGNVEEEAILRLNRQEIRETMNHLSPDQRDVLLLRVFGGLKIEEVARALGKRPPAVQALQKRGLARLKKLISNQAVSI